jgi:hypothetical protein
MTLGSWYWIILILSALFMGWTSYIPDASLTPFHRWGRGLLLFILLVLIGIQIFGSPLK